MADAQASANHKQVLPSVTQTQKSHRAFTIPEDPETALGTATTGLTS